MLSYEEKKLKSAELWAKNDADCKALNKAFPSSGPFGVSYDQMQTPEFKRLKSAFDKSFAELRAFNKSLTKAEQRQMAKDKRAHWNK